MSLIEKLSQLAKTEINQRFAYGTIAAVTLAIMIGATLFMVKFVAASHEAPPEAT